MTILWSDLPSGPFEPLEASARSVHAASPSPAHALFAHRHTASGAARRPTSGRRSSARWSCSGGERLRTLSNPLEPSRCSGTQRRSSAHSNGARPALSAVPAECAARQCSAACAPAELDSADAAIRRACESARSVRAALRARSAKMRSPPCARRESRPASRRRYARATRMKLPPRRAVLRRRERRALGCARPGADPPGRGARAERAQCATSAENGRLVRSAGALDARSACPAVRSHRRCALCAAPSTSHSTAHSGRPFCGRVTREGPTMTCRAAWPRPRGARARASRRGERVRRAFLRFVRAERVRAKACERARAHARRASTVLKSRRPKAASTCTAARATARAAERDGARGSHPSPCTRHVRRAPRRATPRAAAASGRRPFERPRPARAHAVRLHRAVHITCARRARTRRRARRARATRRRARAPHAR